ETWSLKPRVSAVGTQGEHDGGIQKEPILQDWAARRTAGPERKHWAPGRQQHRVGHLVVIGRERGGQVRDRRSLGKYRLNGSHGSHRAGTGCGRYRDEADGIAFVARGS